MTPHQQAVQQALEALLEVDVQYVNKRIELPRELHGLIANAIGNLRRYKACLPIG